MRPNPDHDPSFQAPQKGKKKGKRAEEAK